MNMTRRALGKLDARPDAGTVAFATASFRRRYAEALRQARLTSRSRWCAISRPAISSSPTLPAWRRRQRPSAFELQVLDSRQDAALPGRHGRPGDRARRAGHHHPARPDRIDEGSGTARRRGRYQGRGLRRERRKREDPAGRTVRPGSCPPCVWNRRSRTMARASRRATSMSPASLRSTVATRPGRNSRRKYSGHQRGLAIRHHGQSRLPTRLPTRRARSSPPIPISP